MKIPATATACLLLTTTQPATTATTTTTDAAAFLSAVPTRPIVAPPGRDGVVGFDAAAAARRLRPAPPSRLSSSRTADDLPPTAATTNAREDDDDARSLFDVLSDRTLILDPSGGTCCRSGCSGCVWTNDDGTFAIDEIASDDDDEWGGWIAPYAESDVGVGDNDVLASRWSKLLFPDDDGDGDGDAKIVRKDQFRKRLASASSPERVVSPIAVTALWDVLSPAPGAPTLRQSDAARSIRGLPGSDPSVGNAVPYGAFESALRAAVDSAEEEGNDDGDDATVVDYESMDKAELKAIATERGMVRLSPMKRLLIEELRFYDAHGRQGKRHPTKHTLS